jgi:hypothetical protein
MARRKKTALEEIQPLMVSTAAVNPTTTTRRNIAGSIERTDRFSNIDDGLVPYRYSSSIYGANRSSIDVRDAVVLCQKCYYNFALFRNIIDLMTEFSVSNLTLKGGSKQSRDFFKALLRKINVWDLEDKFFREYYRSGNVFIYRFDTDVQPEDVKKMTQVFGQELVQTHAAGQGYGQNPGDNPSAYLATNLVKVRPDKLVIEKMKMPARYILLNPADIQMMSTLNFAYGIYFKIMTDYEIARLRNPVSEEDVAVFKDLPKEVQEQIKTGSRVVAIPLDPTRVSMVFYKKQDYEPFAVPMGYPVLEDINFKAELRKIDMAIARTMQQMVLLVTAGAKPEEGGVNQKNLEALRRLFENQSVGRVLIADYTTKAQFVVPAIADLLDPKKYEVVNQDINIGLNNVFSGGDKFANQQQRVELFVARLEAGRQTFLNNFLIPEIKRIAKSVGFKNYPTPYFESIELKDSTNINKIYGRLMELGLLTPEQGFKALETGNLPDPSLIEEEQKEYKAARDKGLYTPLIGGKNAMDAGRPEGTGVPQTTKKISPIGTTKASVDISEPKYSLSKMKDNMLLAQELDRAVETKLKTDHKVKRLNKVQKEVVNGIATLIMVNEQPEKWQESIATYCESPVDKNPDRVKKIQDIAATHQVDDYLASLLFASKIEDAQR